MSNTTHLEDFVDSEVGQNAKSAREEFEVPSQTGSSGYAFGLVVTIILSVLIVIGSGLIVVTFWRFTHPQFSFNTPSLATLELLNAGSESSGIKKPADSESIPLPDPIPYVANVDPELVADYLKDLRSQGDSLADALTNQELVDIGFEMCSGLSDGYDDGEVLKGFESSMALQFPKLSGFEYLGKYLLDASKQYFCPEFS